MAEEKPIDVWDAGHLVEQLANQTRLIDIDLQEHVANAQVARSRCATITSISSTPPIIALYNSSLHEPHNTDGCDPDGHVVFTSGPWSPNAWLVGVRQGVASCCWGRAALAVWAAHAESLWCSRARAL